jgi:predicted outer membrane repeat protein
MQQKENPMKRFQNWFGSGAKLPTARRHTFQPRLELLEDRLVPSTWNVTSTADNINLQGTLRWAVAQGKNNDIIDIETAKPIALTQGELYLAYSVTVEFTAFSAGFYAQISGDDLSRVFEVAPAAHVTFLALDISGGNGVANNPSGTSMADHYGGAILNQGTLALTHCVVEFNGNSALAGGFQATVLSGGGIFNNGVAGKFGTPAIGALTLNNCDVSENIAENSGGGIYSNGTMVALQSNFSINRAGTTGGALDNFFGFMSVVNSTLQDNYSQAAGGAIVSENGILWVLVSGLQGNVAGGNGGAVASVNGGLLVLNSTFFNNTAGLSGGAIYNGGSMYVAVSNFTANLAGSVGGAIYNLGTANVESSNLVMNQATAGGGIYNDTTGDLALGGSFLQNSPDDLANFGMYTDEGGNTFI